MDPRRSTVDYSTRAPYPTPFVDPFQYPSHAVPRAVPGPKYVDDVRRRSEVLQSAIKNLTVLDDKVQKLVDIQKQKQRQSMAVPRSQAPPVDWSQQPMVAQLPYNPPQMPQPQWYMGPQGPYAMMPYQTPQQMFPQVCGVAGLMRSLCEFV